MSVCLCVCVEVYVYSDHGGQEENKIASELELKSVVSQMTWVLGSKPWLFARAIEDLNCWTISQF